MPKILIDDGTFPHENSIGYSDENSGRHPDAFQWSRDGATKSKYKVFTDMTLWKAKDDPHPHKLAILIEPKCLSTVHYEKARELEGVFEVIFTHDQELIKLGDPYRFCPFGGSWLKNWKIKEKHFKVSILTSKKTKTEGHKLRHEIVTVLGDKVQVYGEPYTAYLDTKAPAIAPFFYTIVVESCRYDYWFTEKLIDPFSQGTIPIYWGSPSIGDWFDEDGIIQFETLSQLEEILDQIGEQDYEKRYEAVRLNFAVAHSFRTPEDFLAETNPWLLS
jgi:hypothetical protein